MTVDKETLRKIAHLSRLEVKEKNEKAMLESLNDMLAWVEKLQEVDTSGVEPLTTMSKEVNTLRVDEVKDVLNREDGLENAPEKDNEYFKVPKILG